MGTTQRRTIKTPKKARPREGSPAEWKRRRGDGAPARAEWRDIRKEVSGERRTKYCQTERAREPANLLAGWFRSPLGRTTCQQYGGNKPFYVLSRDGVLSEFTQSLTRTRSAQAVPSASTKSPPAEKEIAYREQADGRNAVK